MNKQLFILAPQKSAIGAAMSVKQFISQHINKGNGQGAFDEAWWPCILHNTKEMKCKRNLSNLTQKYFTNRTAILQTQ